MHGAATRRPLGSLPLACLVALVLVLIGGLLLQSRFLPLTESGVDGFQSQLLRVMQSLADGTVIDDSADGALIFVHVARLVAVAPFLGAEAVLGPVGQLSLLMVALMPLVLLCYRAKGTILCLVPLLLPLAVSGRSVLVAVGVAYIVVYMQSPQRRRRYLWLGLLWVTLSSASVMMALLLLLFARPSDAGRHAFGLQRWLGIAFLALMFGISMGAKLAGFESGDDGYQAHAFASDNVVLVALSRSTLATSYVEGQYARAAAYTLAAGYVLFKLFMLLLSPGKRNIRTVILCCLPAITLEGLGMLGLFFPLLWLFLHYDASARPAPSKG